MKFNLNSFLLATSTALDHAEEEIMHITTHHSKRCAYISLRIGIELGLSEEECFDLCSLALMHDNGVTQAFYNQNWLEAGEKKSLEIMEKLVDHCKIGEKNVRNFPFLTSPKNVILYHHEYLNGSGLYGLEEGDIPIMSQVICFADDIDMKFDLLDSSITALNGINTYAKENKGNLYHEEIVEAFLRLSSKISFWRDLNDENILNSVERYLPVIDSTIELKDLLSISSVFSNIIDSKSKFTALHSNELTSKAKMVTEYFGWDERKSVFFQVAANLHDIGKLSTPRSILEKNGPLSKSEFEIVKEHAYLAHMILKAIDGFEQIHEWASAHHERNDGSGYPFGMKEEELSFEAKILACLDMYQALVETRPYRAAMSHENAMIVIYEQVPRNLFEEAIVDLIAEIFAAEAA
ncbi:metal dependent phosphohydrolase [Sulfurimonas gotlandica GD1]|uniref:Metal dependent phosphohydrolase n=1 Tax=Sulfurimonas gotlandica (strain DSM 19862 / JCM 16533 / GD1) TaxID=929558 RepID=B6BHI1_SULGG|nr:HD domain-containing phosphohydrolase [Sulfurimonas gotlandica]EDZ63494.1 HD_GYP hydrolase domain fused to HD hydrolase domain [Sulfurimonas gotlandica GD1]EHP29978.1 metal dependent phosphohydrolase [Sulfurimonas gotlandica GD1]